MSIDQVEIIDSIGVDDSTEQVVLTISDHLEWDNNHLSLLQEKLSAYLRFVESGEILSSYPNAKGREVRIDVMCKYPPNQDAEEFLKQASSIFERAGMKFNCQVFPPG